MWFNFFYVRGEYLQRCKEPIITEARHYYEGWIGQEGTYQDCYSLINKSIKSYTPQEATIKVNNLR